MALGQNLSSGASTTAALFHFDGGATDASGNGNDGSVVNGTYVNGKNGSGAIKFTGTGYSESASSASLGTSTSVWISYWINPASVQGTVIAKGKEGLLNYGSYFVTGNVVNIRAIGAGFSGRSHTTPSGSIPLNTWTKVDLAVSNGDTVPKMWVNGSPVAPVLEDGSNATYVLSTNTEKLRIGSLTDGSLKLDGTVDEMQIRKFIPSDETVKKEFTYQIGRYANL